MSKAKQKKIASYIKLQIPAGKANPAPPIGPALGQHGVNIMDFCKAYNDATKDKMGSVIHVEITVYQDKSFSFILKTSPTAELIKDAAGIKKGSARPNVNIVGSLSNEKLKKIAEEKMKDLNANDIEAAMKIVAGSARSMGVKIEG